jgi:RNA polymerase sigma-70 factor (ECF subfamily)
VNDAELLRAARKDPDAFGVFYTRHADWIFRWLRIEVGNAETAMDLTAETFAQALLSLGRFRGRERGSGTAWIFGIARHLRSQYFARLRVETKARARLGMPLTDYEPEEYEDADERLDAEALAAEIAGALGQVPTDLRETLCLRVVQGLDYAEVARATGVSEANARMRVTRGLRALRARLSTNGKELNL